MYIVNVNNISIAGNVCGQILREVEKQPGWSMAHVIMNPMAESRMHFHATIDEIYLVTKGYGMLYLGEPRMGYNCHCVSAGSVFFIKKGKAHMLKNISACYLEHLAFAFPPFEPADIHLLEAPFSLFQGDSLELPPVQDCFDGAKIISYRWPELDFSVAFGWVRTEENLDRKPHLHRLITEYIYVIAGRGMIRTNRASLRITAG